MLAAHFSVSWRQLKGRRDILKFAVGAKTTASSKWPETLSQWLYEFPDIFTRDIIKSSVEQGGCRGLLVNFCLQHLLSICFAFSPQTHSFCCQQRATPNFDLRYTLRPWSLFSPAFFLPKMLNNSDFFFFYSFQRSLFLWLYKNVILPTAAYF